MPSSSRVDANSYARRIQLYKLEDASVSTYQQETFSATEENGPQPLDDDPILTQSKSGHNDEAFESDRKRTGKFNVEHLVVNDNNHRDHIREKSKDNNNKNNNNNDFNNMLLLQAWWSAAI